MLIEKTKVYHITYFQESKTACCYFAGCNFRCSGCIRKVCSKDIHLPLDLQSGGYEQKSSFLTIAQVLGVLKKEKVNKVIFLGGEPTIDPNFDFLCREIKQSINSFNVLLTNGYVLPDLLFLDEVCLGIKARTFKLHKEYTGMGSDRVFENLQTFNSSRVFLRTESVFIPGYIGFEETERIAYAISRINPDIPHRIDSYIPVPGTSWRKPSFEEMNKAVSIAKEYLNQVSFIEIDKKGSSLIKVLV